MAEVLGNGFLGLFFGGVVRGVIGLLMALLSIYGRANQVIMGMGFNIAALGLLPFLLRTVWGFLGLHLPPKEVLFLRIDIYGLQLSYITIAAIAIPIALHMILHKTYLGLWIKAAREAPEALDAAGHSVSGVRITTFTLGGFLAGLGGGFMPLDFLWRPHKGVHSWEGLHSPCMCHILQSRTNRLSRLRRSIWYSRRTCPRNSSHSRG